jgi:hypothetical protein
MISGGAAGALAKTLVAPLERMRTLAMASPAGMGISKALATAWADGGALGLFKGNMATVLKAIPGTATQFTAYHGLKDHLNSRLGKKACGEEGENVLVHMVAGAFAGAVECSVTYPLETVRTILSMPTGNTKARSMLGVRTSTESALPVMLCVCTRVCVPSTASEKCNCEWTVQFCVHRNTRGVGMKCLFTMSFH